MRTGSSTGGGRERARPADVDRDVEDAGRRLPGRELVGDGPARDGGPSRPGAAGARGRRPSRRRRPRRSRGGPARPRAAGSRPRPSSMVAHARLRGFVGEPALPERRRAPPSGSRTGTGRRGSAGRRRSERSRVAVTPGSFWRTAPAAALRGLAKGGLVLAPPGSRLSRSKAGVAHVDLAPDLDAPAAARGSRRDGAGWSGGSGGWGSRPRPSRPSPRVAPRLNAPVLVQEGHAEAVDLGLADVAEARAGQGALDARLELAEIRLARGVLERQHRRQVLDRGEGVGDLSRRRAASGESGVTSSGCSLSSARSSRMSASYSASETSGRSSA